MAVPRAIGGVLGLGAEALGTVYDTVTGNSRQAQERLKGMATGVVKGLTEPFTTPARGIAAYAAPDKLDAPTREEWEANAEGAGANAALLGLGKAAKMAKPHVDAYKNPSLAAKFQGNAEVNTAKSLRPVTLQDKAITKKIAPEMSRRGIRGTGNQIDQQVLDGLDRASARLKEVHSSIVGRGIPVETAPMKAQVEYALNRLKVKGTNKAVNTQSVKELEKVRDIFRALPDQAPIDQILDLHLKLDDAADAAGAFRIGATSKDLALRQARRGGADIVRRTLNDFDPALKAANQEYSFYRHGADVVERRQLGEVGQSGGGLPSRGGLLDDILAGWAGNAIGGPAGSALLESANLARQTRWWASVKGSAQQKLAERLKPGAPTPKALLGQGSHRMPPVDTGPAVAERGASPRLLEPAPTQATVRGPTVGPSGETIVTPRPVRGLVTERGSPIITPRPVRGEITENVTPRQFLEPAKSGDLNRVKVVEPEVIPKADREPGMSDRWHMDRDLSQETAYFMDGDGPDTANAAIGKDGDLFVVEFKDGASSGPFRTLEEAVRDAENRIPQIDARGRQREPVQNRTLREFGDTANAPIPQIPREPTPPQPLSQLESAKLAFDQTKSPVKSGPAKGLKLVRVDQNPTVYVYSDGKGTIKRFRSVQQ